MNRRKALKVLGTSLGAGTALAAGGAYWLLPPRRSRQLATVDDLARRLFDALTPRDREIACVEYDHPYRQYHNRGVWGGGLPIRSWTLPRAQRGILTDLFHAGLSEAGRERVPDQLIVNWPGVHVLDVLICGDPHDPPYQIILTGPHLNLRLGGACREGFAFGGPQVYGDQRGDDIPGLPGNVYRYQFRIAERLFRSLRPEEQESALLPTAPIQTLIEPQGRAGSFPGVPVAELSEESHAIARELIEGIIGNYPAQDVAYAWRCLEENGGLDGLFLSYYEETDEGRPGECQVFRLEGPGAVLYFRGHPHVHAFINIAMDGDTRLSVGEKLGENPSLLAGDGVKALFETALRAHLETDLAHFPVQSVVGRLLPGTVRSGDIYSLESWQDHVAVVAFDAAELPTSLPDELRGLVALDPDRTYTIATTGYIARALARDTGGRVVSRLEDLAVRDATIAYLKQHGLPERV